jgi:hypothetical protein
MKRYTLLLLLTLQLSFSQVYVSNNSFIYNRNSLVFVTGNVELNGANSNFYLRNEGQLLQGTTGASSNRGLGSLSVFQEGTSDNFDYNYWCSPVGNSSVAIGNENFGITMFRRPTTNTNSTPVTITNSFDGLSSNTTLDISRRWIWKYLSSNVYDPGGAGWIYVQDTSTLAAGQGFTMKGTSGSDNTDVSETALNNPGGAQRYDFRGKPNDGNIIVGVDNNMFTLTGNPYPSALHVNAFLLDPANTSFDRNAYYWEHDKTVNSHLLAQYRGGYGTYSPISLVSNGLYVPATFDSYNPDGTINSTGASSGLIIERKYAPIGQGFMVRGNTLGTVSLRNSHREYYTESGAFSQFERVSNSNVTTNSNQGINSVSHLRLNTILNNQYTRQIALAFLPDATDAVDPGIDALSPNNDLPNDAYFYLENDNYVIQGINFDVDKRVKLGVKVTGNSSFRFNLLESINFDPNQNVYLFDADSNIYHNLKESDYYVTLSEGVYNNRFEITFKNAALNNEEILSNNLFVNQNNDNQVLMISNPKSIEINSATLYDITGKLITKKLDVKSNLNYEISTASLSDGVYVIQLISNDSQSFSQKVIVKNSK